MSKNYFIYQLKEKRIAIIFFFVIYLAISLTSFLESDPYLIHSFNTSIGFAYAMSILLTFVLPIALFGFVHNRRSTDVYFALPISRKQLGITSLVFMFLICFGYFFISSVIAYLLSRMQMPFGIFCGLLGISALSLFCLLCINSLFFLIANNFFDGIIMVGAYTAFPYMLYSVISGFYMDLVAGANYISFHETFASYLSPLYLSVANFYNLIEIEATKVGVIRYIPSINAIYILCIVVYTLLALYGLYCSFVKRKSERAEQVSNSFFAYPFVIHSYALGILAIFAFGLVSSRNGYRGFILYYLLLLFIYVVALFVYKRKIQLTMKSLIFFSVGSLVTIGIALVGWKSRGFGLADQYRNDLDKYVTYSYYAQVSNDDLSKPATFENEDDLYVSYTLTIPVSQLDFYADAINILELCRRDSIDLFYLKGLQDRPSSLTINNAATSDGRDISNSLSYRPARLLSEKDLKALEKYGSMEVWDPYTDTSYSVQEFIEKRGN